MHLIADALREVFGYVCKVIFERFCGWIGHITVKAVTWGKVDLEWGESSESVLAESIGIGVLLVLAAVVWMLGSRL